MEKRHQKPLTLSTVVKVDVGEKDPNPKAEVLNGLNLGRPGHKSMHADIEPQMQLAVHIPGSWKPKPGTAGGTPIV